MIKILTSEFGMGTYIPALFLYDSLSIEELDTKVYTIEMFFTDDIKEQIIQYKTLFHKNLKAAQLGHKLANQRFTNLLSQKQKENIMSILSIKKDDVVIVFSGIWLSIIQNFGYIKNLFFIHMDTMLAPSWQNVNYPFPARSIYMFDNNHVNFKIINYHSEQTLFPLLYIHGGGWGMGDYLEKAHEILRNVVIPIKMTVFDKREIFVSDSCTFYTMDLLSCNNEISFPNLYEIRHDEFIKIENVHHTGMYELLASSSAIITKPGGGSLLDSIQICRPIIFLTPIAVHETSNMKLWISLGFGITYEDWQKTSYSFEILEKLKGNLCKKSETLPLLKDIIIKQSE